MPNKYWSDFEEYLSPTFKRVGNLSLIDGSKHNQIYLYLSPTTREWEAWKPENLERLKILAPQQQEYLKRVENDLRKKQNVTNADKNALDNIRKCVVRYHQLLYDNEMIKRHGSFKKLLEQERENRIEKVKPRL